MHISMFVQELQSLSVTYQKFSTQLLGYHSADLNAVRYELSSARPVGTFDCCNKQLNFFFVEDMTLEA